MPDPDYDLDAARAAGVQPDERGHLPDTYKLPNHMTFSDESIYHNPINKGGHWQHVQGNEWNFTPGPANLQHHSIEEMQDYFSKYEPESHLILSGGAQTPEEFLQQFRALKPENRFDDTPTADAIERRRALGLPDIRDIQRYLNPPQQLLPEAVPAPAPRKINLVPVDRDPFNLTLHPVEGNPFA